VKQRPVFILLTFFLALISVVMITFVFLRTQLSEDKLQKIVEKTIYDNFVDFKVNIDQIGLSLGTKFRYKIGSIKVEYRNNDGVFNYIELKDVAIKFPLFFLVGKQDIDVSVGEMYVDGFNYSQWIKNNYKITSLTLQQLAIPRFLADNRVNLIIEKLKFEKNATLWPSPLNFDLVQHLVIKNLSFSEKSAIEFDAMTSIPLAQGDLLKMSIFAIGDVQLGQFVSNITSDAKILFEVKNVDKPEYIWLSGQRFQFLRDSQNRKNIISLHGNSAEGKFEVVVNPNSMNFQDIQVDFKIDDLIRDNSKLKNIYHVIASSINMNHSKNSRLLLRGSLIYVINGQSHWISHISSIIENDIHKAELSLESIKSAFHYSFKLGNDLSYRKVNVECLSIMCKENDLKVIEMNFYNQILSEAQFLSLQDVLLNFSTWWSNASSLLAETTPIPMKIYWRKNRWSDFEFDLYADISMNKKSFATENIKVKSLGNDLSDSKISFSLDENEAIVSRMITQLKKFPSSVLSKLIHDSGVEISGHASGMFAIELSSSDSKYSADLKLQDGTISWLNFDDLYRRKLYQKPDDEIKFPNLNWVSQFKNSDLTLQWTENNKMISWELVTPKNFKKLIKLEFKNSNSEVQVEVNFPGVSAADKKYLQSIHEGSFFNFTINRLESELKFLDSQMSAVEESN
jgi:hypothetical protein